MKALMLVTAAAASVPTGILEGILMDPLAPCLLGAIGGEAVRSLWPVEASTENIVRRMFVSALAVIFGTVFAYYAYRAVPFSPPAGLAKLLCGVIGWGIIKGFATLQLQPGIAKIWTALENLAIAVIKAKGPKE